MESNGSDYLRSVFSLEGKVAAVMGAGGHLCSIMALALSKAGAKVACLDKDEQAAQRVVQEIRAEGGQSFARYIDVTDPQTHRKGLADILSEYGKVDILINGAGINAPTSFFEITLEEWHAILDSHVTATFLACQIFGKHMVGQKKGSIINISSMAAGPPLSKAFAYSVAKSGIRNLTQNLAREWAVEGVRVNALRPGFFPTQWSMKNFINPDRQKSILSHTPMGRYGKPQELVGAVLWLASDAAGFVTGSEVSVDGGFSCMTI